ASDAEPLRRERASLRLISPTFASLTTRAVQNSRTAMPTLADCSESHDRARGTSPSTDEAAEGTLGVAVEGGNHAFRRSELSRRRDRGSGGVARGRGLVHGARQELDGGARDHAGKNAGSQK